MKTTFKLTRTFRCFCFVAALSALPSAVHARVGETHDAVVQRYGRVIRQMDESIQAFRFGDFFVLVAFQDRISVSETYSHDDEHPLTKPEIASLLKANAGEREWTDTGSNEFETADKAFCAKLSPLRNVLIVTTPQYRSQMKVQAKEKTTEKMKGF